MKKNSFKSLATVLSLAMAATALPVNANAAAVPKMTVSKTSVKQKASGTAKVSKIKKGYKVKFTSSNKNVLTLTGSKKSVTKKATGKTLSIKYTAGSAAKIVKSGKKKATIKAVVYNTKGKKVKTLSKSVKLAPAVSSITAKQPNYSVKAGQNVTVGINDLMVGSTDVSGYYTVTYTSSDESVLQSAGGADFKAVKAGTATVTATATNNAKKSVTTTMTVTVTAADEDQNKPNEGDNKPNEDQNKPGDDQNKPGDDQTVVSSKNFKLEVVAPADAKLNEFKADPTNQVTLTVRMTDKEGLIKEPSKVAFAVSLKREVDAGGLSKSDLTLTWNGKDAWEATTIFSGTKRDTKITVPISATLRSIEGDGNIETDTKNQLEGLTSESKLEITLVPTTNDSSQTTVTLMQATDVTCISMDRLIITFNKDLNFAPGGDFFAANGSLAEGPGNDNKFHLAVNRSLTNAQRTSGNWKYEGYDDITDQSTVQNKEVDIVQNVLPYDGDSKKAIFVLKNGCEMKDNSQFAVRYYDRATNTVSAHFGNTLDGIKPQVSRVESDENKKMTTIRVTFTKPVNMYTKDEANKSNVANAWENSALNPANYIIDSHRLTVPWKNTTVTPNIEDAFGADNVTIVPTESRKDYRDSVDITLGKVNNVQRYFTSGSHLLQVTNVGDYAWLSDKATAENMIATETKGFTIATDNTKPTYEVIAQSPEQFIMQFNCHLAELEGVNPGQEVTTWDAFSGIYLAYRDLQKPTSTDGSTAPIAMTNFQNVDQPWNASPAADNAGGLGQKIRITNVTPTNGNSRLKVEVVKDWTDLPGWKDYHQTYTNYTFAINIASDKVLTNIANNLKTGTGVAADADTSVIFSTQTTPHNNKEVMGSYDGKSPEVTANGLKQLTAEEMAAAGYATNQTGVRIIFNEPVQAGNTVFTNANTIGVNGSPITPAWDNVNKNEYIPVPEMSVVAVNDTTGKTYKSVIQGYPLGIQDGLENYAVDATFINGDTAKGGQLPAGTYTVYIKAVSDDIGNTMATTVLKNVTFSPTNITAPSDFRVLAVLADKSYGAKRSRAVSQGALNASNVWTYVEHDKLVLNNGETETNASEQGEDAIYVEFSKQYGTKAGVSVLEESNWTLNGRPLPAGSRIVDGISDGYKKDQWHEPSSEFDTVNKAIRDAQHSGITIVVPNGTITDIYHTTVTLNKNVQDKDGNALAPSSAYNFYAPAVLDKNPDGTIITTPSVFTKGEDEVKGLYTIKGDAAYWNGTGK